MRQRFQPPPKPNHSAVLEFLEQDYSIDDEHELVDRCERGELLHCDSGRIDRNHSKWAGYYYDH